MVVAAGCSTTPPAAAVHPVPQVATATACEAATQGDTSVQPVQIVVKLKADEVAAGNRYLTIFGNHNASCMPSGSGTTDTQSFTFAPNITAARASEVADDLRTTGLFASVTEITVPPCTEPGLTSGSCTPPTTP